jgi:hypothetical protein
MLPDKEPLQAGKQIRCFLPQKRLMYSNWLHNTTLDLQAAHTAARHLQPLRCKLAYPVELFKIPAAGTPAGVEPGQTYKSGTSCDGPMRTTQLQPNASGRSPNQTCTNVPTTRNNVIHTGAVTVMFLEYHSCTTGCTVKLMQCHPHEPSHGRKQMEHVAHLQMLQCVSLQAGGCTNHMSNNTSAITHIRLAWNNRNHKMTPGAPTNRSRRTGSDPVKHKISLPKCTNHVSCIDTV